MQDGVFLVLLIMLYLLPSQSEKRKYFYSNLNDYIYNAGGDVSKSFNGLVIIKP
jgi:hypothetical protein